MSQSYKLNLFFESKFPSLNTAAEFRLQKVIGFNSWFRSLFSSFPFGSLCAWQDLSIMHVRSQTRDCWWCAHENLRGWVRAMALGRAGQWQLASQNNSSSEVFKSGISLPALLPLKWPAEGRIWAETYSWGKLGWAECTWQHAQSLPLHAEENDWLWGRRACSSVHIAP